MKEFGIVCIIIFSIFMISVPFMPYEPMPELEGDEVAYDMHAMTLLNSNTFSAPKYTKNELSNTEVLAFTYTIPIDTRIWNDKNMLILSFLLPLLFSIGVYAYTKISFKYFKE